MRHFPDAVIAAISCWVIRAQASSEYRARMRTAPSGQEREQIRLQHHAQMQECAAERGIELPDAPR